MPRTERVEVDMGRLEQVALAALGSPNEHFSEYYPPEHPEQAWVKQEFSALAKKLCRNPDNQTLTNEHIFNLHCLGRCIASYRRELENKGGFLVNINDVNNQALEDFVTSASDCIDTKMARRKFALACRIHKMLGDSAVWVGGLKTYWTVRRLERLNEEKRAEVRKFLRVYRNYNSSFSQSAPSLPSPLPSEVEVYIPHVPSLNPPPSSPSPPAPPLFETGTPNYFLNIDYDFHRDFNMGGESVMFSAPALSSPNPQSSLPLVAPPQYTLPDDPCNGVPFSMYYGSQLDTISNPLLVEGAMLHGLSDNPLFSSFASPMTSSLEVEHKTLEEFDKVCESVTGLGERSDEQL